jgi:hypothetical protein
MSCQEKIQFDFNKVISYKNELLNAVGAGNHTEIANTDSNCKYVKKYGSDYAIGDITNIVISTPRSDGGGVNKWWYEFYNQNNTLLGTVKDENGASVFVDGTAEASTSIYIKIVQKSGTVSITNGDTIILTTDIDTGGLTVYLSGESFTTGDLILYLSLTGSTYYDQNYKYGGYRHAATGTQKYPYTDPKNAIAALGGAFVIVTILDNETYEFQDNPMGGAYTIQSITGGTPKFTNGIGAGSSRPANDAANNSNTIYVGKDGSDSTGNGTFQAPYLSLQYAENNLSGRTIINIKDSEKYEEELIISTPVTIEPIAEKTPTINGDGSTMNYIIDITTTSQVDLKGLIINGSKGYSSGINMSTGDGTHDFIRCTVEYCENGFTFGGRTWNGSAIKCKVNNNINGFYWLYDLGVGVDLRGTIENSEIHNNNNGVYVENNPASSASFNYYVNILNNLIYLNTDSGIKIHCSTSGNINLINNIKENTIASCNYGINLVDFDGSNRVNAISLTCTDNIVYKNTTSDLYKSINSQVGTFTYCNVENYTNWTSGANNIFTDPYFVSEGLNIYGISFDVLSETFSGAYRSDSGGDNIGKKNGLFNIDNNNINFIGIIFDGQNQWNNAFYQKGTLNYNSFSLKYCDVINFIDTSIDIKSGAATTSLINNCYGYNNGIFYKSTNGFNDFNNNILYENYKAGLYLNRNINEIIHNTFFNTNIAIYLESLSAGVIIKNNITHFNTYGIYSEVTAEVDYNCITDNVKNIIFGENVIEDDPLFINIASKPYNFNLITTEGGDIADSPCKNAGDDGKDLGAYEVDRGILSEIWESYKLDYNPRKLDLQKNLIDSKNQRKYTGDLRKTAKGTRRLLPFEFGSKQYTTDDQRAFFEYLAEKCISRENSEIQDFQKIKIHLLPEQLIYKDITGTVDTSNKKILITSTESLMRNKIKGFFCNIKHVVSTNIEIVTSSFNVTFSGVSWNTDEHSGKYFKYIDPTSKIIYINLILGNNTNTLLLGSVTGLSDGTGLSGDIETHHYIKSNETKYIYILDPKLQLVDGSFKIDIDFISTVLQSNSFGYKQVGRFKADEPETKTGYKVSFEEITEI